MTPFISSETMRDSVSPSSSPSLWRSISRVKKDLVVLKKAMTRKTIKRVANKDRLAALSLMTGAQSSQDKWKKPAPRANWKAVSRTVEELGVMAKDKKGTWVKSCRESSNRDTEVFVLTEEMTAV